MRPDAVGVGVVGGPEEVALAEERDQRHRRVIFLEGRVDLPLEEFGGLGFELDAALVGPEILGFPQAPMAVVELLDQPGQPAGAGLGHHHLELGVTFEDAPGEQIDKRFEEISQKELGVLEDARRLAGDAVARLPDKDRDVPGEDDAGLFERAPQLLPGRVVELGVDVGNHQRDLAWEKRWSGLEETGIILSWHITVFVGKPGDRVAGKTASVFENTKFFLGNFLEPFVDLFSWGILERHPKLKMVMAEAGTGWLPWLVQELDYRHWRLWEAKDFWADKGGKDLETNPSELFKRQIWATFQEDYAAMSLIPFFGEGHLLWASDYPHPDSVWPNSRDAIERQMRHLSPEMRRKLTHDNAAALYGLGGA